MSTVAIPQRAAAADPVLLRFGAKHLTLLHVDFAVITLWFIVTAAPFRYDELLLYPMALYFTFAFVRDRHATWPVFKRGFVLVFVPSWWLLSTLWSPEPALAAKSGLQVLLTIIICMFMASRLTMRQMMIILLIALIITALRSIPRSLEVMARGYPALGIYAHKNSLGNDMSILVIISFSVFLSNLFGKSVKNIAVLGVILGLFLVFASESATAILVSIGMIGIVFGAYICLGQGNSLTIVGFALVAIILGFASALIGAIVSISPVDPVDFVLNALGKDRGLTGRAELWTMAMREIEERPLLGTGAHGYWRYEDSPFIRQLFIDYYKKAGHVFHFHNSWLELSVNLGIIGSGLAAISIAWAFYILISRAFFVGGALNWALLAIACAILARTMTEADFFVQFVRLHMLLWVGVLIVDRENGVDNHSS